MDGIEELQAEAILPNACESPNFASTSSPQTTAFSIQGSAHESSAPPRLSLRRRELTAPGPSIDCAAPPNARLEVFPAGTPQPAALVTSRTLLRPANLRGPSGPNNRLAPGVRA